MLRNTIFRSLRSSKHAVIGAALILLAAHGASAQSGGGMTNMPAMSHADHAGRFTFGEPGKASKVDRVVEITMRDISFEPSSLKVKAGQTVRFVVTNKSEIEHELALGDAATQIAHRKEMAEMAEHGGAMHHGDPNAVSVEPGKTAELIWRFTRAGNVEFDCNVPGHYEAGMKGVIVVRP